MLRDFAVPEATVQPVTGTAVAHSLRYRRALWDSATVDALLRHLTGHGRRAVEGLGDDSLMRAWESTVEEFLDPASEPRRRLDPMWSQACALSPAGLQAGVQAVLGGVRGRPLRQLLSQAGRAEDDSLISVILAANLPALAVQPLLPALAARRPVLLKSPSSEPFFAATFVTRLAEREPRLGEAVAALTWRGGDARLERPVMAASGRVLAYGEAETMARLRRSLADRLVAYGPKISLAVIDDGEPERIAEGLARDVALFDQRGCLSVHAVLTTRDAEALAQALARQLSALAESWPPGPAAPAQMAAVQQLRADAALRGLCMPRLPIRAGSVVVETDRGLEPSPGLRTVRIHPIASLEQAPNLLMPWRNRLQGVALSARRLETIEPFLRRLGVSRVAPPGELQSADALWHNGGAHPLDVVGAPRAGARHPSAIGE